MGPAGKVGGSKRPSPWRRLERHLEERGEADRAHAAEPPLRSELFSADQMEQHGLRLASADRLTPGRVPERLLARMAANEQVLIKTCGMLTTAVTAKPRVTPVYRLIVESLLGLRLDVDRLHLAPCLPAHWGALTIHDRYRETSTAASSPRCA
jgi:hypothetical protein